MDPARVPSLYERIVETTLEGVWVIDANNVTTYVNASMAAMLGWPRDEVIGRSLFDFMDDEGRRISARNIERRKGGISEAHEFVFRRRDGRPLWTKLTTNPLRSDDGTYEGAIAVVTDIGPDREREQERLRLWRIVDESLNEIYVFRERDLRFEYVNRGAIRNLGFTLEELLGKTPLDIKPEHSLESFRGVVEPLVSGRVDRLRFETVHERKDGTVYPVEVHLQLVARDGDGRFFAIINDITERREAERSLRVLGDQLAQSQRLESIGRLAGGIAHDFNNILTTILSGVSFLQDAPLNDEQRTDLLEIGRAAERASQLTNQLLAFARKRVIKPRSLNIGEVLRDQARFLRRVLGEETTLELHIADGLWPVLADPTQVEQVILNLAVNARDAMPTGGRFGVEVRNAQLSEPYSGSQGQVPAGEYVVMTVRDTGAGIAKEVLPNIFEPFFTTKPVGAGTGLGLATVYGIVKQSGGHLCVESALNAGTTFKLFLPRTAELSTEGAARPRVEPKAGSERVLVVEDDEAVRRMVVRALEDSGYRVHAEPTPEGGLRWAQGDEGFDLLVTDVMMPGMSGKAFAEQVLVARAGVPVLFISGYAEDTIVHRGAIATGVELLLKPFSPADLCGRVRGLLDRARS